MKISEHPSTDSGHSREDGDGRVVATSHNGSIQAGQREPWLYAENASAPSSWQVRTISSGLSLVQNCSDIN